MSKGEGTNQESIQRQLREDAEKLHPWPSDVYLGPDISALNVYNKAQLQRSYRKWTPIDLVELARVSKLVVLADIEFERYVNEGVVVMGGRNLQTPVENPRGRAVNTLNSMVNQILRRLGIAAMSVSDKRSTALEAEVEREARDSATKASAKLSDDAVSDDTLLN